MPVGVAKNHAAEIDALARGTNARSLELAADEAVDLLVLRLKSQQHLQKVFLPSLFCREPDMTVASRSFSAATDVMQQYSGHSQDPAGAPLIAPLTQQGEAAAPISAAAPKVRSPPKETFP